MLKWLPQKEFWSRFDDFKKKGIFLSQYLWLKSSEDELIKVTNTKPVDNPDEGDFPGPVKRWYGDQNGKLFTLTLHDLTQNETGADVILESIPLEKESGWSFILNLPEFIHSHILFLNENFPHNSKNIKNCVFYTSELGIKSLVYSSETEEEAENLISYLGPITGKNYFIDKPESRDDVWIIVKNDNSIVGRYPDRQGTEEVAHSMSICDSDKYEVVNETTNEKGLSFQKGVIVSNE